MKVRELVEMLLHCDGEKELMISVDVNTTPAESARRVQCTEIIQVAEDIEGQDVILSIAGAWNIPPCRRCSECANNSHHWLPNPDFGNDDPDETPEHNPRVEYICKHCEQEGEECRGCDGEGCEQCENEGVIPLPF